MKKLFIVIAATLFAAQANAGLMCADRYTGNTVVSTDCELGSTNNDSETQVNLDLMFGFDDWVYAWKDDTGDALPTALTDFSMDVDLLGGTFQITWANPSAADVMFVLKDGNDDPDTYVGWLLDPGAFGVQDYTFESPFLNTTSGSYKQISHASFYYRNGEPETRCVDCNPTSVVPVPATMPLFGLGLAGLIYTRRRNKA